MDLDKKKAIIEAILYSAGRPVEARELMYAIEVNYDELSEIISNMKEDMLDNGRGLEIIRIEDSYQLCTKKEYYEYIYPIFDKRSKPNLSNAALETLSIIAYNPKITKAQIEAIRGVSADGTVYKLLEYNLIEEDGKLRIVSLNPFKKSRVAIAQIKRIDVNKSGLTLKIKNQPDRIFYMRKWPKKYFLDALAVHPDFRGSVELTDNLIKLDYFETYKSDKKAPTKS